MPILLVSPFDLEHSHADIFKAVMWVAELIAQVRGESLVLANNPTSEWDFEPHAKVRVVRYAFNTF